MCLRFTEQAGEGERPPGKSGGGSKKKPKYDNTKSKFEETLKAKNLFPSSGAKGGEGEQPFPQWRAGSGGGGDLPGGELGGVCRQI